MLWSDAPDADETIKLYKEMARVKAEILDKKRAIERVEDKLKEEFNRQPAERRKRMIELLDSLNELEVLEVQLEWEIKLVLLRVDMYKAVTYRKG
jgi:seryl-tRNA synthetase